MNPIFSCSCMLTPMLAFMLAVGTGMSVYRKGYNGFVFGILYVLISMSAVLAGAMLGIVIAVMINPNVAKDEIGGTAGLGGSMGMMFGVLLMGTVVRLMPDSRRKRPFALENQHA